MEANKKLNEAFEAVFNSAEWREMKRVVMELRDNGGVRMTPTTERNADNFALVTGWSYDQLQPVKRGKTMTEKIRKTLGYSYSKLY